MFGNSNTKITAVDGDLPFRQTPHNIEAEQAMLGAILINNDAYDRVSSFLEPHHFYDQLHGRIFEAAVAHIQSGLQATPITLKNRFDGEFVNIGLSVAQYLGRLAASATSVINARDYGRTIRNLSTLRDLITIGEDIVNDAYGADASAQPDKHVEKAEAALYALAEHEKFGGGFKVFSSVVTEVIETASGAYRRTDGLSGISTGLRDLDKATGGLQPSDLIILAGRPSMGKTALATNIAFNVARAYQTKIDDDGCQVLDDGGKVGFFSLEMSASQLAIRIISERTGISSEAIRRGNITEQQFSDIQRIGRELNSLPLFIDDTGGISIAQLAARARKLKRQHGIHLLIVDYLQLLAGSGKKGNQRVQEVSEITVGLKALAKELNVPIIALSQLSRQVENREDKRPQLADLRESGSIEQDADIVMFVYRDEYYLSRKEPSITKVEEHQRWELDFEAAAGLAEVIIGKQRHGPISTVNLQFSGAFTRFSDLDVPSM